MTSSAHPILAYTGPREAQDVLERTLRPHFRVETLAAEPEAVALGLRAASALLDASMRVRITRDMIDAAPHLRVVAAATTGADHIDQAALARRGIPLWTLQGQTELLRLLTPAAEHSWLLVMACARRLRAASAHVLDGGWDRSLFPGIMLRGKRLGLVGCGRIGTWMARYAAAFGMECQGYDPAVSPWPPGITRVELDELASTSDVISIHVPLTASTRGLFGPRQFGGVKPGCIFVNTSRGDVIDEAALLESLQEGRVGAAGLDVLSGEPDIAAHPLLAYARTHDNLLLTPHIGGNSPDAVRQVVEFSARRILRHFGFGP
jgi:D-3-phosphoglycerate dehydrogenase